MGQEVIGCSILIHTANKVRDGIEEMLFLHNGRIEDDMVTQFLLRPPNMVGHTLEHFEAEAVLGCLVHLAKQIGIGDSEEVMRSHTDMQHTGVFGF